MRFFKISSTRSKKFCIHKNIFLHMQRFSICFSNQDKFCLSCNTLKIAKKDWVQFFAIMHLIVACCTWLQYWSKMFLIGSGYRFATYDAVRIRYWGSLSLQQHHRGCVCFVTSAAPSDVFTSAVRILFSSALTWATFVSVVVLARFILWDQFFFTFLKSFQSLG